MALVLSSFGKMLLIVMVVWDYGRLNPTSFINAFVFLCNLCAISVTLDLDFVLSLLTLVIGHLAKVLARVLAGFYHQSLVVTLLNSIL